MSAIRSFQATERRVQLRWVVGLIILFWLAYTVHFALYLSGPLYEVLRFVPGILGIGVLLAAGLSPGERHLRVAPISRTGLAVLTAMLLLMVPVVLTGLQEGGWVGWDWVSILIYAPVDGIAQELFFRAALLPALMKAFKRRPLHALSLHAVLFALYHVGMFTKAPAGAAVVAMIVTFLAGVGWGWQVQRDRTVVWAMVHHSLLQVILKMFAWG